MSMTHLQYTCRKITELIKNNSMGNSEYRDQVVVNAGQTYLGFNNIFYTQKRGFADSFTYFFHFGMTFIIKFKRKSGLTFCDMRRTTQQILVEKIKATVHRIVYKSEAGCAD